MKRLNITLFCLIVATNVFSAELPKGDEQLIETAGVQIYPGAIFVNGNKDVGFRFATDKTPEDVRGWYRKQLSAWSLYEEFGGWILYGGKPEVGMGELISKKQVSVKQNTMMHDWFGIDSALSTELVIMIPEQ
jgi:hypothetical protein